MKKILLFALACCCWQACIREIDLKTETGDLTALVVDGSFTDAGSAHRLRLSRPNKYGVSVFEHVSGAEVRLFDDAGNSAAYAEQNTVADAWYELPAGALAAVPGRAYHLEIRLPDGRLYRSEPQQLPRHIEADSILVEGQLVSRVTSSDAVITQKRAVVSVRSTLPADAQDVYLRWEADCVYFFPELPLPGPLPPPTKKCYVSEYFNAQRVPVQEFKGQGGKQVTKEIGSKLVDFAFNYSLYFNVVQRSVSLSAYVYWDKLSQVANPEGTVFDAPPGPLRGNIIAVDHPEETPLGFFEVAAVDTIRRKLFNGNLGPDYFVNEHCTPDDYYFNRDPECYDCLRLENSTLEKPWYWQ